MKHFAALILILALGCLCCASVVEAQSGRRAPKAPKASYPVPPPAEPTPQVKVEKLKKNSPDEKVYQCLYDDRPILDVADTAADSEEIFSSKDVASGPRILKKINPAYTPEARRNGTSGKVVLKALLSSTAKVTFVRVVKGLPNGLTESAVKAACRIRFEPARKDGHPVGYYVIVEYEFWTDSRPILGFPPFP